MARPRKTRVRADLTGAVVALGYGRVSTEEQADSGFGLDAQDSIVRSECARHDNWTFGRMYVDPGVSAKSLKLRPELGAALAVLDAGEAQVLIVAKLDRLTRSLDDFLTLANRAERGGWAIVVCDIAGLDMTSPIGKALVRMLATFAELERQMIGERTRVALASAKSQGTRLGRRGDVPAEVLLTVNAERAAGRSWREIAAMLERRGYATVRGGRCWYPATVRAVWLSQDAELLRGGGVLERPVGAL